jgi:hypothetical protein
MESIFTWLLLLLAGMIASYASVPALVRGLQSQAPFEYSVLGSPETSDLFTRAPNRRQYHFLWFVLCGDAYSHTQGSARVAAVFAWLGYVLTGVAFFGYWFETLLR